jgi:AraC family transcriptional regulator
MRSRKLAASALKLMTTGLGIIDIAGEYDFPYEQSYIRAFKKEYGITPGELRKSGAIIKVTPPLEMFDKNKLPDGAIFGPEIVMVPGFRLIGKRHIVTFDESVALPPRLAKTFWLEERAKINGVSEPDVYYGLTRIRDIQDGYSRYMPSVRVNNRAKTPENFDTDEFPAGMCARFRYIGRHHYYDITADIARGMYDAIVGFVTAAGQRYVTQDQELYFERIDTSAYDGTYCQMEWFTPISEKYVEK